MEAQIIQLLNEPGVNAHILADELFLNYSRIEVEDVLFPLFFKFGLDPSLLPKGKSLQDIASLFGMAKQGKDQNPGELSEDMLKKLGDRIRSLREKKGYSNYEVFANEHNIARAQYWRYENGQDLRFTSLTRVVNAFGMTLAEFFSEGFD